MMEENVSVDVNVALPKSHSQHGAESADWLLSRKACIVNIYVRHA